MALQRISSFFHRSDTSRDLLSPKREVPMKVICLGLARTGTVSLSEALEQLDVKPCYTFRSLFQSRGQANMFTTGFDRKYGDCGQMSYRADEGKPFGPVEMDMLFGRHMAIVGMTAYLFAEELVAAYPDAKVILTTRDVESWTESLKATFDAITDPPSRFSFFWAMLDDSPFLVQQVISRAKAWYGYDRETFSETGVQFYREYCKQIRRIVPKANLLEYSIQEGWVPLCNFLEVPQPDRPFPKVNTGHEIRLAFQKRRAAQSQIYFKRTATVFGFGAALLGVAYVIVEKMIFSSPQALSQA